MKPDLRLAALLFLAPTVVHAQDAVTEVVVTSPLSAANVDAQDAIFETQVLDPSDLSRTGTPSLLRALGERSGQIQLNNGQGNPFQPNVSYRGFDASPLVGNAQGLAVYVDGARLNQAFGDTVNWDLLPDTAINSVVIEGANPVYGLNALGGSIDVRLKTGEDFQGFEGILSGGSFGRKDAEAQVGGKFGNGGSYYLGARALEEDGWRDFSPSQLRQIYGDIGFAGEKLTTHLKFIGADNALTGNGTSPVELLAVNREAVFTHPDRTQNEFGRLSLTTEYTASDTLSFQGSLYAQSFRQATMNGDAADIEECDSPYDGLLCAEDEEDEPLTDADGVEITDFLNGEDYAFLNRGNTKTDAFGGAVQLSREGRLFDKKHKLVAGVSFDGGSSTFRANSELGALSETRGYEGPGVIVESGDIGSVGVRAHNRYYGVYIANVLELTPQLSATLSGRYNAADVTLRDLIGTELNGQHSFSRFNPAVGLTWKSGNGLSLYGGYSEANRAPTPAELSCADPDAPCSLTNFFIGDPPLKQVVARTFEAGARGRGDGFLWSVSAFSTQTKDDIMFVASETVGRAYFQNVGKTRRQGVTGEVGGRVGKAFVTASASVIDATFQSPLLLNSPENPFADADGQINVVPGNDLPGVAKYKFKLAVDYDLTNAWSVNATAAFQSGQVLFGDESNLDSRTDSFTVVNLGTAYKLTDKVSVFGSVENLFDQEYETLGTYSPVDEVPLTEVPNASDTRALSPAAPRAAYVGLKVRF